MAKNFKDLSEREILALAISLEEEDGRIYADFAEGLRETYPASARVFEDMMEEESVHRGSLFELYRRRFGEHIPLIRRQDVRGFVERRPVWLIRPLGLNVVRKQAEIMEAETRRVYELAAQRVTDASTRKLLGDLAEAERKHSAKAESLTREHLTAEARDSEEGDGPAPFRAPDRPTRIGGPHGRVGLHAGAAVRGGVCHKEQRRCVPGGPGRVGRSGDLHGLRGGALG